MRGERRRSSLVRFGARTGAFVGTTIGLWGCFEADVLLHPSEDIDRVLCRWVPRWARALLRLYRVELRASGPYLGSAELYPARASDGAVGRLFVMNHRSGMDILITLAWFEAHLVSRADLAGWPMIGRGARRVGTLFVDRSSRRSGAAVLTQMIRGLEQGRGIALYPEGTAFSGDEVRPLQPGAFKAAQRTGAEIVPVGIAYADEAACYGDESFLAHLQRVSAMSRIDVAIEVGEPLRSEGASLPELRDQTRAAMQALVLRARASLRER